MGILNLINYFPQEGQIVRFDYISMIFVAIIIVALIIGVIKGLFSSLLSLASTLGSILISCVLCGYVYLQTLALYYLFQMVPKLKIPAPNQR